MTTAAPNPPREATRRVSDDLEALYEWIREPDWSETFGTKETVDWLNRRPCSTPILAKETIADLTRRLAEAERREREAWCAGRDAAEAAAEHWGAGEDVCAAIRALNPPKPEGDRG